MSINITYIQKDIPKKVQSVTPVSSIQKIHHEPFKKQGDGSKQKDQSSVFQEVLDSAIEDRVRGIQKRK